jgi:hypothetical protein
MPILKTRELNAKALAHHHSRLCRIYNFIWRAYRHHQPAADATQIGIGMIGHLLPPTTPPRW